jgi:hypothetical protein
VLRGLHIWPRAQPQSPYPALPGALDDCEQQLPSDTLPLRVRGDRERPDIRLRIVPRKLTGRIERLKRYRPEDAAPGLVRGDEHHAVSIPPESPQRLGVPAPVGQPQRPVRRNPQFSNERVLVRPRIPNDHVMHATSTFTHILPGGTIRCRHGHG